MSRNKALLLAALWFGAFFLIPSTEQGLVAKEMMIRITTYLLIGVVLYLAVTLHMLRKALKRVLEETKEDQVKKAARLLRITFDVKRAFGAGTLRTVFERVNKSRDVSMEAKNELYEALRRKRVDIPPPAVGKRSCSQS